MSKREDVLIALFSQLQVVGETGVRIMRNEGLPSRIPELGIVILYDGNPGEPEYTLSPLTYHYQHQAELLVAVQNHDDRDTPFDALCGAIGTALATDPTLGGACDWVEAGAPSTEGLTIEGAVAIKAARILLTLHYAAASPLA